MSFSKWSALFRRSSIAGASRPGRKFRPRLEALEEKILPAQHGAHIFPTFVLAHQRSVRPQAGPASSSLTPSQVRHAYGFDQISFSNGTVQGNGAGQTIAIVDAYDDPNIASDLRTFDTQFGLAAPPGFTKVGLDANGVASTTRMPAANAGWAGEIALDVEWAHAIAPAANILLVEANSSSITDLIRAVDYARSASGVVAVSMSWGSGEFSGETSYDGHFATPTGHGGVAFFGSSGDSGSPAIWPALSTHVVAVGGSSLHLNILGNYGNETAWSGSGGGRSSVISAPGYQSGLVIHNGSTVISASGRRVGPDVSYDADPNTGVAVYDSYGSGGWVQVGGTSAAAPQWAALTAIVDQGLALQGKGSLDGYTQLLPALYGLSSNDFHDVTSGSNGGFTAGQGFDLVTGRGTPVANLVVADLVGTGGVSNNQPPTVAQSARVVSQTSTTATLSVLGTDDGGESNLTYTWAVTGGPGSASFSANGTNASKNTTATFTAAGTYTLQVTVRDAGGLTATSQTSVTFTQTLTSVAVTPGTATVAQGTGKQFTATAFDQFGAAMTSQPGFSWTLSNPAQGTVDGTGLFTAAQTASGSVLVQATAGGVTGSATVTISTGGAGAVLFQDNFENGAGAWSVTSGSNDYFLVTDHGSQRLYVTNNGSTVSRVVAGQSSWTNYSYQATLDIGSGSTGSASLLARVQDTTHLYFFGYNIQLGEWMIAKRNGSTTTILATSAPFTAYANQDYTVRAEVNGSSLKLYVNGVLQVSTTDATYASGKIGFSATNATAELDDVVVTQL